MKSHHHDNRLVRLIADKLVPWSENSRLAWMVATRRRKELQTCEDVLVKSRKVMGKEMTGARTRQYRNSAVQTKRWPADHLNSVNVPKLTCVLSGNADLQFYDYVLHAPESTFIFIPPDVPQPDGSQGHVNHKEGGCDVCWMMPRGDKLHFWACRSDGPEHFTLQWSNVLFLNQRLNLYLQLLHEEVLTAGKQQYSLIPHLLHLLMGGVQREAHAGNYLHFGQEVHPSWKLQISVDPIAQAQDYIDAHYGSAITLEGLSRTVGMSRSLFAQRFKQQTGQTMGEYLTRRRLMEAKQLLRRSEWTVSMISEFVGFRSQNYFYSLFRRYEDCSPLEFRSASTEDMNNRR